MLAAWLVLLGLAWGQQLPSDQTLVYFNARMALREGRPLEATKLWLLRNAIEDQTETISVHDPDFHSVTWAALGDLGVCQDGYPTDDGPEGAGLWPLALHNWVVRNRNRRARVKRPNPFDAFELDRQARYVSVGDVLSFQELRTVSLFRGGCLRPRLAMILAGSPVTAKLSERKVAARLLRYLLRQSKDTLARDKTRGRAVIDARIFDLQLMLTEIAAREARQRERDQGRLGRIIGLSRESVTAMREDAAEYAFLPGSEPARILEGSVHWPASEWLALSADRRLFIFDHARGWTQDEATLDATALQIIDELAVRGEGAEVTRWIAHRHEASDPRDLWAGARGEKLLALDGESGFGERSVIALHRGVDHLERGDLPAALRSMAFALNHSHESVESETVHHLSLRWLTYIASQFEITDELLVTLQQIVTRREYGVILEDLMWSAAFRADGASFDRGMRNQAGSGALERRVALLAPLALGDLGAFGDQVRDRLEDSPSETMRFLGQLVERLELEEEDVRELQLPTLVMMRALLLPIEKLGKGGLPRKAAALRSRAQAMVEGLGGPINDSNDRARSVDPSAEVYAGSVRLAPVDPLPWPFAPSTVGAPSVFAPLELTPVEWRGDDGEWVYGWSISE